MNSLFIPYEQALELKQLGFNEFCLASYMGYDMDDDHLVLNNEIIGRGWDTLCEAPLYQQVFKWFRDKHNLYHEIQIDQTTEPKFCFNINKFIGNPKDLTEKKWNWEKIEIEDWYLYRTYEEGELECLKKLIEIVKNEK